MDLSFNDLIWLHGDFETDCLPPEKEFLKKYFKNKEKKVFLYYMNFFNDSKNFTDHTGIFFSNSMICRLQKKYIYLIEKYKEAKKSFDLKTVAQIESGELEIPKAFDV